jgi:hypothetical protein
MDNQLAVTGFDFNGDPVLNPQYVVVSFDFRKNDINLEGLLDLSVVNMTAEEPFLPACILVKEQPIAKLVELGGKVIPHDPYARLVAYEDDEVRFKHSLCG